ncbi:MAG TPA: PQQ-dependent sugar dehydrogenase, partial [Blastocatellia bacterium]|nr:PQQ-dependent sugar dehydrogenase [Blastocatellia bacterium]
MKKVNTLLAAMAILALASTLFQAGASVRTAQDVEPAAVALEQVLSGLNSPVYVTGARDGTNRLFIVEQPGRIQVLQPGSTTPAVFLTISTKVAFGGERGLLGLAFHPQFRTNRRFFVNYTRSGDGATVIAEYRASAANPNVADTNEIVLLVIPQPFANHNGGMIEFGPDGYLYIGMGDGGSANDPGNRAQNVEDLLGKMLRIDIDRAGPSAPYSSPSDNPFFGPIAGRDEIYATGLRNPFRFSFDRITGQLYAGDVGQNAIEEIDIITRGGNYGWRVFEGTRCTNNDPARCGALAAVAPITEYSHSGGRCSVTGGYVYRGGRSTLPAGAYVFGDFCTGETFLFNNDAQSVLMNTSLNISSFGEDDEGELYVVGLGGTVHRIINTTPPPPPPPPTSLRLDSAFVRKRSSGETLQPVTTKKNGKKFEVVASGEGFASGAVIQVNGRNLKTKAGAVAGREIIGRLRREMLRNTGTLTIDVMNPGGAVSNQIIIQVVAAAN